MINVYDLTSSVLFYSRLRRTVSTGYKVAKPYDCSWSYWGIHLSWGNTSSIFFTNSLPNEDRQSITLSPKVSNKLAVHVLREPMAANYTTTKLTAWNLIYSPSNLVILNDQEYWC
jgi:hypothetical protein